MVSGPLACGAGLWLSDLNLEDAVKNTSLAHLLRASNNLLLKTIVTVDNRLLFFSDSRKTK